VAVLTDDCDIFCPLHYSPGGSVSSSSEILPQGGMGSYLDLSDKGEAGGACSQAHILQKFAAGLMKVTTSHRHQSPSRR